MHNNMPTDRTVSSKKLVKIAQSAKKQATQRPVFLEETGTFKCTLGFVRRASTPGGACFRGRKILGD
jgi:hypothetical protein